MGICVFSPGASPREAPRASPRARRGVNAGDGRRRDPSEDFLTSGRGAPVVKTASVGTAGRRDLESRSVNHSGGVGAAPEADPPPILAARSAAAAASAAMRSASPGGGASLFSLRRQVPPPPPQPRRVPSRSSHLIAHLSRFALRRLRAILRLLGDHELHVFSPALQRRLGDLGLFSRPRSCAAISRRPRRLERHLLGELGGVGIGIARSLDAKRARLRRLRGDARALTRLLRLRDESPRFVEMTPSSGRPAANA